MRAVSLVRGVVAGAGLGADAATVVPLGRGKGVLVTGGGGGSTVRGAGTLATGDVGNGFCATGGLGIGTLPGLGTKGAVSGGSEVGGRDGRLIRTVSSSSRAAASPRPGGRVIRTVSFFGSFASAMITLRGGTKGVSEISRFVTRQLTLGQ